MKKRFHIIFFLLLLISVNYWAFELLDVQTKNWRDLFFVIFQEMRLWSWTWWHLTCLVFSFIQKRISNTKVESIFHLIKSLKVWLALFICPFHCANYPPCYDSLNKWTNWLKNCKFQLCKRTSLRVMKPTCFSHKPSWLHINSLSQFDATYFETHCNCNKNLVKKR